jgi:uncharacterized membrane protein YfcA
MPISETVVIAVAFVAAAALYASVGHAGASAYLAVMGLFDFAPGAMKPTALALNILVAAIATIRFYRAGLFRWSLFWPFAIVSIPAAFLGGAMMLPTRSYKIVVGVVLLYAAVWMFRSALKPTDGETHPPPIWAALFWGATIGLLSGLTGVGGGIFLSPLLLYMGWAETRATSGVAAPFILVNSMAGLLGHFSSLAQVPSNIPLWAVAVALGGWLGATYGSRRAPPLVLRQVLSLVLLIAGAKLVLGG